MCSLWFMMPHLLKWPLQGLKSLAFKDISSPTSHWSALRLSVRTPGFQPGKRGSIPLGRAMLGIFSINVLPAIDVFIVFPIDFDELVAPERKR